MSLPNPGMDAVPFTPLTAEFVDNIIENVEALADGTGLNVPAIMLTANPYKFRVSRNAAANTGNAAFAVIAFDTEQFDTNNNVSAGVYTAPVTGYYQFNWGANTTTVGTETFLASLFKNGSEYTRGSQLALNTLVLGSTGSDLVPLTAGDTVDVRVYCSAARALNVGNTAQNFFSGYLVSKS